MPGKVVSVLVANGQRVQAGQQLLVLAAMKMEHAVGAPKAGVVCGLAVAAGSQVEDGQVLLRVEAEGAEAGA
jgi:3-methylcrotonyl-CoA carboxylase alpha subunit